MFYQKILQNLNVALMDKLSFNQSTLSDTNFQEKRKQTKDDIETSFNTKRRHRNSKKDEYLALLIVNFMNEFRGILSLLISP